MTRTETFESRIQSALQVKLDIDFPISKGNIRPNLDDLLRSANYGSDAVLLALLNCTVGGSGNQPLEAELVAAASPEEKKRALQELMNSLLKLQKAGVEQTLVGDALNKLQRLVQ